MASVFARFFLGVIVCLIVTIAIKASTDTRGVIKYLASVGFYSLLLVAVGIGFAFTARRAHWGEATIFFPSYIVIAVALAGFLSCGTTWDEYLTTFNNRSR